MKLQPGSRPNSTLKRMSWRERFNLSLEGTSTTIFKAKIAQGVFITWIIKDSKFKSTLSWNYQNMNRFFPLEALVISLQLESKKARPLVLSISSSFSFVCTQYHLHNLWDISQTSENILKHFKKNRKAVIVKPTPNVVREGTYNNESLLLKS